jgi:Secretion system C-terminal sorting domain
MKFKFTYFIFPLLLANLTIAQDKSDVIQPAGEPVVILAHDYACGPFLSYPGYFIINTYYSIKTKVSNVGSSAETSVPIKFFVDNVLINITNLSLPAGGVDSVSNNWMTPGIAGSHTLMYVSALATDMDRTNDTVRMTINVLSSPPPTICPFNCQPPITYIPITGGIPGPTGDDNGIAAPIGFTFNYVGKNYTQVWICTNGFIQMGPTGVVDYTNLLCSADTNMIAPFWDDLNTLNGGNIQYTTVGNAPNRIFITQFTNVGFFSGTGNVTFQIVLYENGGASQTIDIIYGPAINNASSSGSIGLNVAPGGSGNINSITPGPDCGSTTFSQITCNNSVIYNMASGTRYRFCMGPEGISQNGTTLPPTYSLEQNYPNPFNPTTNIKFGIPKSGLVKLVIYDVLGRVVETVVNEFKEAGTYKVDFDASKLASGVYFYKLESGDFTAVKKMLLVK